MPRCDHDVVFHRVFCVTLLAVAFTFIVILTNVFVDIDGLLSNKKKYIPQTTTPTEYSIHDEENPTKDPSELIFDEEKNYDSESNPFYRTKRSIDTNQNSKSPAMKKILTRRLAKLLEELDEEEAKNEQATTLKALVTKKDEDRIQSIRNEDLLHLAMHNILLQGLVGHMDLNDVYKKVHMLVKTFNKGFDNNSGQGEKLKMLKSVVDSKEILRNLPGLANNYNEEHKFFEELIKCKKLEDQIAKASPFKKSNVTNENLNGKDDKMIIKTVIEIHDDESKSPNRTRPNENIEGLVRLIFNGKSIKIKQMRDENAKETDKRRAVCDIDKIKNFKLNKVSKMNSEPQNPKPFNKTLGHMPNPFLNKVLKDYLAKYSLPNYEYSQNSPDVKSFKTQRLKRQIKIRYPNNSDTLTMKQIQEDIKNDDDDLSVEIETHFDGKGIKGEKKKKLVKSLIDKIQKALRSEKNRDSVEHIKFVKRTQDPIYSQYIVSHEKTKPFEPIKHRLLDTIGKTSENHEKIANRLGDSWKKLYYGPNFLSVTKAVNSAEMNEVDVDYNSVLRNGIPKRLQAPLNTQVDDEGIRLLNPHSSNVTLFLKDIDGSGFSIGFNQYEGEPPDVDSMKMFNGIENLIKEYHKTYDRDDSAIMNEYPVDKVNDFEAYHDVAKRNVKNLPKDYRRSITELRSKFYNAKLLKIFFKENPSFHNYLNIFKHCNHELKLHSRKDDDEKFVCNKKNNGIKFSPPNSSLAEKPIKEETILNIMSKPSTILSTTNYINQYRKRRSINVKKILNLKSKIKLNRYLNTKAITSNKIFIKNNRNKRHVNNIRIVERGRPKASQKWSDEIFTSRELNSYVDRQTVVGTIQPEDINLKDKNQDFWDDESPFLNIYRIQNPQLQTGSIETVYNPAVTSNNVMSKYPHIFLDKSSISKEEKYFDEVQYRIQALPKHKIVKQGMETTTDHNIVNILKDVSVPKFEDFVNAMNTPLKGNNYRITVKMSPKNKTNTNTGFKEVHTSVNKSYDGNGVRYYTLLNVSQLSKIEKLNKTDETTKIVPPLRTLIDQQKQIEVLLKLHKKRFEQHLDSLLRESNYLKSMIESNNEYNIDKTIKQLTHDDNSTYSSKEEKLIKSVRTLQETHNNESKHFTTSPTSSKHIAAISSTTEALSICTTKIVDTIKDNDNLTSEILRKIDTNTQLLQILLRKIPKQIDMDKIEHISNKATEKSALEIKLDLSKDWKSYGVKDPFFVPSEIKNHTVPFVYAYQQHIPRHNKSSQQGLASLVYHGHIHSIPVEDISHDDFKKPTPKMVPNLLVNTDDGRRKFNESKYFIDGINNFKVIPSDDRVISADIKINTTHIV